MRRTRSRPAIQAGILIQSKTDLSACLHSLTMSIWRQKLQQSAGNFCLHSKVLDKVDDKECMKEDAMSELIYGDNTKVGYLRTLTYKESWGFALKNISEKEKDILRSIPNWDAEIFYEITGVRI